ncbi:hypothetical protein J437_LFUL011831 [Ladona fulva]|uniref:DEAD-box helicase OB fold domain-containing protein n=1 Tax=Ladona fulva TaxID=123851 RepID=A0A8K0KB72_LADFU|nr:hypothetical protein J437_LFUL011831 [Ladona fulva]
MIDLCMKSGISKSSCGQETEKVRKGLIAGNFSNIAQLQKEGHYLTIGSKQVVHIHPSSVLFRSKPPLLIFGELVMTGKCYMRQVSTIEPEWVSLMMPSSYFKRHCLTG